MREIIASRPRTYIDLSKIPSVIRSVLRFFYFGFQFPVPFHGTRTSLKLSRYYSLSFRGIIGTSFSKDIYLLDFDLRVGKRNERAQSQFIFNSFQPTEIMNIRTEDSNMLALRARSVDSFYSSNTLPLSEENEFPLPWNFSTTEIIKVEQSIVKVYSSLYSHVFALLPYGQHDIEESRGVDRWTESHSRDSDK